METEKSRIIEITPSVVEDIDKITAYIFDQGNPLNSAKFAIRLLQYIYSISQFPATHSPCRNRKFKARNWHCAVFENNYIIAYKIFKFKVVVHAVINGARLK